jgi:hypothetical protein
LNLLLGQQLKTKQGLNTHKMGLLTNTNEMSSSQQYDKRHIKSLGGIIAATLLATTPGK